MAHINLLPWRDELRKERQKEFFTYAGLAAIATIALVAYANLHISGMIENQTKRNEYLQEEIAKVKKQIKEIDELKKLKEKLLARMEIIQQLQARRPQIVHLFDELVDTIPDGVYLSSINHAGKTVNLKGVAQSNARVAAYMRNIEESGWLASPNLEVIQTTRKTRGNVSEFTLSARQMSQSKADAKAQEETKGDS